MQTHYQAIYLAPHLDDAALSCGGQIVQQTSGGDTVLIVTVMAGDPQTTTVNAYIQSLHERWALAANAAEQRRQEDLVACRILGATAHHLSVPDCIYRFNPVNGAMLYQSDADIFGDVHPAEETLFDEVVAQLTALPSHERVYAPLTVGHHVDHLLVRTAAEQVWGKALRYYEDYPYAQKSNAVDAVIGEKRGWQAEGVPLTANALAAKIEAVLAFRSQISTFWRDRADLERQVKDYADQVGGERVWWRT